MKKKIKKVKLGLLNGQSREHKTENVVKISVVFVGC